jgi:hypothetical protein
MSTFKRSNTTFPNVGKKQELSILDRAEVNPKMLGRKALGD